MIRLANYDDLAAVNAGYNELFDFEEANGSSTGWVRGIYPTRETAEKGLAAGTLYVLEEQGKVCAHMVLNRIQPPHYAEIPWQYPAENSEVTVIHTLCVPPSQSGHGYATQMVRFAIDKARKDGMRVLRIDTWIHNRPATRLYQKLGFQSAGTKPVKHEGVLGRELLFMEYPLL